MSNFLRHFTRTALIIVLVLVVGYVFITYYSYIFSKEVIGVIQNVERASPNVAVVGGGATEASNRELFSFAIGIRTENGEIVTGSSEDRQWAVAKPGLCAEAKFYPYPFWQVDRAGTYFGARLIKLYECATGTVPPQAPAAEVPKTPAAENKEINQKAEDAAAAAAATGAMQKQAPALNPPPVKH